jgi:hypothetical protein
MASVALDGRACTVGHAHGAARSRFDAAAGNTSPDAAPLRISRRTNLRSGCGGNQGVMAGCRARASFAGIDVVRCASEIHGNRFSSPEPAELLGITRSFEFVQRRVDSTWPLGRVGRIAPRIAKLEQIAGCRILPPDSRCMQTTSDMRVKPGSR